MKRRKHRQQCIAGRGFGTFIGKFLAKQSFGSLAKTAAKKTLTKAILPAAGTTAFDVLGREIFGKGK